MLAGPQSATGAPERAGARLGSALLLVLVTVLAYAPSLPGEFIWDDDHYVVDNPLLEDPDGLARMWVPRVTPQYYPAVFSLFWAQYQLWGLEPLGYHAVNLGLHALSALLVWRLARRLRLRGAWVLGAAFALHPVHVESVAWVTELKNVLSGTFYLAAAHAYLSFDERWRRDRAASGLATAGTYLGALLLFALALLSKTVTFSLPAALVLVMVHLAPRQSLHVLTPRRLAPLLPLFALGIALALVTAEVEAEHVGASGEPWDFGLAERALISSRALLFYPAKLLLPWPTIFSYPRWDIDAGDPLQYWSVAAVLGLVVLAARLWLRGRRSPVLAACFYAGSIAPALGFISFYPMLFSFVADHFCYLASLGVLALVAGGLARTGRAAPFLQGGWLVALGLLTALQAHRFRSAESLYRHTLRHNPESWLVQSTLGTVLLNRADELAMSGDAAGADARIAEAVERFSTAVGLYDDHHQVQFNLATALFLAGDPASALRPARRAVEIQPQTPKCHWQLGRIQLELGQDEAAIESLREAVRLDPDDPLYAAELGRALVSAGRTDEGLGRLRRARDEAPDPGERVRASMELARGLATTPGLDREQRLEALEVLKDVDELAGGLLPETLPVRAEAQARLGRFKAAVRNLEAYLRIARENDRLEGVEELEETLEAYRRGELPAE